MTLTGTLRLALAAGLAAAVTALLPSTANAAYPDRPIRLLVPFSAGGPTDAVARVVGEYLTKSLGQNILIDNRGGAGGRIATEAAAAAPADGYTVFFATTGTMAVNPVLYRTMTLDPVKAFDAVGAIASSWNVLIVPPAFPAKDLNELVQLARKEPGKLTFGSAGNGSTNHLSGELLKIITGVNIQHIPYKGSAGAFTDLIGGQISMMFDTLPAQVQNIQSGRVRALAQTARQRSEALPGIPTMIEAGIPDFDVSTFFGLVVPKGTPADVRVRLHQGLADILGQSEVRSKLLALGAVPIPGSREAFDQLIQSEVDKWGKLVKTSGATVE
ncbi:MAG: Bug family tripartite tricarboxylate transporter substrate binding protein [Lautropia sp.]